MAGKNRKDHRGRVLPPPNVSQKSDRRYIWRKMIGGHQYILTDNDLNELKKKIVIKESELQNGIYAKNPRLTLNEWFDKWISVYKGNVKTTTKELYIRTWKDVDLFNGIISVNYTMHYSETNGKKKFFVTTPKTKSGIREIPIVSDLRKQLIRQREYDLTTGIHGTAAIDGYTDFVFHTSKGTPYSTAGINLLIGRIVNRYNRQETDQARKENREPELLPNFSPHILRHTFCTRFCENESNIKVIQEIMGHQDIKTMMDIYSHVTKEKSHEVMNELGTKIKIC